ncbi:DUF3955 domain-containing protein [Endozoicomonas sp. ALD040]|uniref:DUF3955 domain-containing protein n=1 Tax=unclassified Endozoicomonas TaxID=2644528 RepID=UPI003BAE9F05
MFRKYKISLILSLCGIGCLVVYYSVGAYVNHNGILTESFGFLPLFWIFQLLALVAFAISFFKPE